MTLFKTPTIPPWIQKLSCSGYKNVFELGLGNANLYGTETLLGDWDGNVLFIAKDFAPVDDIVAVMRREKQLDRVFRHNDGDGRYRTGLKTNSRLLRFVYGDAGRSMLDGHRNLDCGALYISACFFLKEGSDGSSNLTGWRLGAAVFEGSLRVAQFVIDSMPNLRAIACLGAEAETLVAKLEYGSAHVRRLPHPSRGANADFEAGWTALMREAELKVENGAISYSG